MTWMKKGNPGCGCCEGGECPINVCADTMPNLCEVEFTIFGYTFGWAFDPGDIVWESIPSPPDGDHDYCQATVPDDPAIVDSSDWHVEETTDTAEVYYYYELSCPVGAASFDYIFDLTWSYHATVKIRVHDVHVIIRKNIATNQVSYKVDALVDVAVHSFLDSTVGTITLHYVNGVLDCTQIWTFEETLGEIGGSNSAKNEFENDLPVESEYVDIDDCTGLLSNLDMESTSTTPCNLTIDSTPISAAPTCTGSHEGYFGEDCDFGCVDPEGLSTTIAPGFPANTIYNYYRVGTGTLAATFNFVECP